VTINGKQVKLAEDRKDADREFYRIMAADNRLDDRQRRAMRVDDACEAMLASVQHFRENTRRHYSEKLGLFAEVFGTRRLEDITAAEVKNWVAGYQPPARDARGRPRRRWGETSRAMQFGYVRLLFKWARESGILDRNPFALVENPWQIRARGRIMDAREYEQVMADPASSPQFKEVVEFVWRTGARPGEVAIMAARHMDVREPIIRLQSTEYKTGRRTNLPREIYVPPDLWERLRGYAERYRQGPLLRRPNGQPWTAGLITSAFSRAKRRLGLDCVLYQARHAFITAQLDSGTPLSRVAKLVGHTKTETTVGVYYHPDAALMAQDVAALAQFEAERTARIAREVAERKADEEAARKEHKRKLATAKKQRYRARLAARAMVPVTDDEGT
jgi:site-specific recombinase XerD